MNSLLPAGLLVLVLVITITAFAASQSFKKRDTLLESEKGKIPSYTENCGAFLYCRSILRLAYIRKPLARVAIYDEFMVVNFAKKIGEAKFLLKLEDVDKIEIKKMRSAHEGLHIYYQQDEKADYLILVSDDLNNMKARIGSKLQPKT